MSAFEPLSSSLFVKPNNNHLMAQQWLEPGQNKHYDLMIMVHTTTMP